MHGKVCVITGASSGIGRATALELARRGATLALVCRDPGRADATVAEIERATGNRSAAVFLADLGVQGEVRGVAAELLARHPRVDVLINNAGLVNLGYSETEDRIETVFAVNHLAYFLLTELLLDRLRESAPARVVNVASNAHKFSGGIRFDDLGYRRGYKAMRVYGQSKLANILFTLELARRLEGSGVTANCLHPGAVASRLGKNNGAWARALTGLLAPFFRSEAKGAETSIYLATAPELERVSGRYFANCREVRPAPFALDPAAARRLWEVSERLTGVAPGTADTPASSASTADGD